MLSPLQQNVVSVFIKVFPDPGKLKACAPGNLNVSYAQFGGNLF